MPESPPLGSISTIPFLGCSKHLIIPATGTASTPNYSWPADQCTKYVHTVGENTPRKPHCMKADDTTWICQNCQVLTGRQITPHNCQPPTSADNFTRPFGRDCHVTMMSMWLQQDTMIDTTYVDTVTTCMSVVSLRPDPMVMDHPTATLEDVTEQESED